MASATSAETTLAAMPSRVDTVTPSAGMSTKPASTAPAAAPARVGGVEQRAAARRGRGRALANQRTASGKVAPSARAGTITIGRHATTRTTGKSAPPAPSW